jgi:hypothetical protein
MATVAQTHPADESGTTWFRPMFRSKLASGRPWARAVATIR